MDNFIFSESLELSILEHRLITLFEILEKVGLNFFFPALLYNETFWQTPYEKRVAIINSLQMEWTGSHPRNRSYFYVDPFFLNLIKSIKVAYFSYTKLDLKALIDLFKAENSRSITPFANFGDIENSPVKEINKLAPTASNAHLEKTFTSPTLAKVSAVKFYTRFFKKESIALLLLNPINSLGYWENFLKSLELIDRTRKSSLISKISITLGIESQKELLEQNIQNFPFIRKLYLEKQIVIKEVYLSNLETTVLYDYIFANTIFSNLPTDILLKYNKTIYSAQGRLMYIKAEAQNIEDEKKKFLLKNTENKDQLKVQDLFDLDYEIIFEEFENRKVIDLLEESYGFPELSSLRFSVPVLTGIVKLIKTLKPDGGLDIWDYSDTETTQDFLSLFRKENGEAYSLLTYPIYTTLLKSFSDIQIETKVKSVNEVISSEVSDNGKSFISLEKLRLYLLQNRELWREIFDIQNLVIQKELNRESEKVKYFEYLRKRNIYLLGLPTYLYNQGFKRFKLNVEKNSVLKPYVKNNEFSNSNLGSYEREFVVGFFNHFYTESEKYLHVFMTKDSNSPHNKEFNSFLDQVGLDKEKVMNSINLSWDKLVEFTAASSNVRLLEIVNISEKSDI